MKVRVKFFAILRERAGTAEVVQELSEGATVGELWHGLQKTYPKLDVPGIRLLYAVNQNYVHLDEKLRDGDEVVFLPPVSGGESSLVLGMANDRSQISNGQMNKTRQDVSRYR